MSEQVIGDFLRDHPHRFSIATKGGIVLEPKRHFDNSRDRLRSSLEGSLKRLGVDHIDLYYVHRREQERPVEEVVETLAEFVREGKIGGFRVFRNRSVHSAARRGRASGSGRSERIFAVVENAGVGDDRGL